MNGVFYVCDACGSIVVEDPVHERDELMWTCANCGGHSAWEFPPEKRAHAETHAARIVAGVEVVWRTCRGVT